MNCAAVDIQRIFRGRRVRLLFTVKELLCPCHLCFPSVCRGAMAVWLETDFSMRLPDVINNIIERELAASVIQQWFRSFDGFFGTPALVHLDFP